jgi:hypothetical protein
MLAIILFWLLCGVIGSVLVALGTRLDGQGIDRTDVIVLVFFAITGPFWLLVSVPFGFFWLNSLFGDDK